MDSEQTQLEKFKQAARDLETDDDPKRFGERIAKLVTRKPVEKRADDAPEPASEEHWRRSLNLQQQHLRELEDDNLGSSKLIAEARRRVERIWEQGRPEWREKGRDRRLPSFLKHKPVEKPEPRE